MKKVMHFFSRTDDARRTDATTYRPREPTLNPAPMVKGIRQPNSQFITKPSAPHSQSKPLPSGYAEIVAFFNTTVSERKSPYNGLVEAADRLKKFIPDETSRLQAALAIGSDQWLPDALSLAISTHISDIEIARKKARGNMHSVAADRTVDLRNEANRIEQENVKLTAEIKSLTDHLAKLETALIANNATLASLDAQIQMADANHSTGTFFDQAAENLKNDLLAKKIILGLP